VVDPDRGLATPVKRRAEAAADVPGPPVPDADDERFAAFYARHRDEVLRFAFQQAGTGLDAEDIASEAWKRAYVDWRRIRQPRPWVYRVVIHLAWQAAREPSRVSPNGDPDAGHGSRVTWRSASSPPGAEWAEQVADISRALQQLSARQRAAVLLSYRGWKASEIAEALGCSAATARVHLHSGRARLRKLLAGPAAVPDSEPRSGLQGRTA
jgi:RNA polymerase sigma-70 factor, ECF subfamily